MVAEFIKMTFVEFVTNVYRTRRVCFLHLSTYWLCWVPMHTGDTEDMPIFFPAGVTIELVLVNIS